MIRLVRIPHSIVRHGLVLGAMLAAHGAGAAERHRFTGIESCSTSGCHGGGLGKNQVQIHRKDQHANAASAMGQSAWSAQLQQKMGITNIYTSAQCNECHAPYHTVPANRFAPDLTAARAGTGVSCESCHGPAEFWLRSHTRTDYTHDMRTQIGMRDMKSFYSRANTCVGCHQNIDPKIVANGHVPLTFELDDYDTRETAHWKTEGAWLGPRRWLTGQAVALREVSWSLTKQKPNPEAESGIKDMRDRAAAISWVLRKTDMGSSIPSGTDHAAVQTAADRLAREASGKAWTRDTTMKLFRTFSSTGKEFGKTTAESSPGAAKRGYMLAIAMRRLYIALRDEGNLAKPNIEKVLDGLFELTKSETSFDGEAYARLLEQIEIELVKN